MARYRLWVPLVVVAIVGWVGIVLAARWGIGLLPDSASYVGAARQLQEGDGLSLPSADGGSAPYRYFAPLYPVILAVSSLGSDPMVASVWVNGALLAGSVFLSGVLIYRGTGSIGAAVVGAVLVAVAPDMLRAHSLALSEPPFIFFCVLTWVVLAEYIEKRRMWLLVVLSVTTGLAFLSRYSGAGLVAANGLALLILGGRSWGERIRDVVVMGVMSSGLPLVFMMQQGEGAGGRPIAFHPIPAEKLAGGIFTVARWFVPEGVLRWLAEEMPARDMAAFVVAALLGLLGLTLLVGLVSGMRRIRRRDVRSWLAGMPVIVWVLLIFCFTYMAFLIFTISFIDAFTWLEARILLASHIALVLALVCMGWRLLQDVPRQLWQRRVLAVTVVLLVVSYVGQGVVQTASDYREGVEFKGEYWRNSEALDYIEGLGGDTVIYSNNPEVIYLYTGRMTGRLPFLYDFTSLEPNPDLDAEITAMGEELESSGGYIVYFSDQVRNHVIAPDDLAARLKLRKVDVAVDDAVIYTPQVTTSWHGSGWIGYWRQPPEWSLDVWIAIA